MHGVAKPLRATRLVMSCINVTNIRQKDAARMTNGIDVQPFVVPTPHAIDRDCLGGEGPAEFDRAPQ
jgi:hypothetical protein